MNGIVVESLVVDSRLKQALFLPGGSRFSFSPGRLKRAQLSAENEPIQAGACLDHVSLCLFSDSLGNHDTLDGLPSVTGSWLSGSVPYCTTSESR